MLSKAVDQEHWVLRPSVSVVPLGMDIYEFFQTSSRRSIRLRMHPVLVQVLARLDGQLALGKLGPQSSSGSYSVEEFVRYLHEKCIVETKKTRTIIDQHPWRRVLNFLGDYFPSLEVIEAFRKIQQGKVAIIGAGAVGSWVAIQLAHSGVRKFTLIDDDVVEGSNLNRSLFSTKDVGRSKVQAVRDRLQKISSSIEVVAIEGCIAETTSCEGYLGDEEIDVVVNCADEPSVDATSLWLDGFCQARGVPYVIAGGYNMHLSLIGITVIPGESACVKCGNITLKELQNEKFDGIKKLMRSKRGLGNLGPLAAVTASFCASEVIRLLVKSKRMLPAMLNRRAEFNYITNELHFVKLPPREECGCVYGRKGEAVV